MDGDTGVQIILLILSRLGASYCAASEIAFASLNTVRMKNEALKGNKKAKKSLKVVEYFDKALTTLLIGNNLMNIGFASLATLMATQIWGLGAVKYTTIASTIIIFLFSELVPKSYAKANSEKYALRFSGSLLMLMKISSPIVRLFSSVNVFLEKILPEKENEALTDEEFLEIIETAHKEGSLDESEKKLVKLAIQFEEIKVKDIYIKLKNVEMVNINEDNIKIIEKIKNNRYSRMPVYENKTDNIVGILQSSFFIKEFIKNKNLKIQDIMSTPIFVKEDKLINDLLKELSDSKFHMAIVRDNKNKSLGIVTIEDILEELVGEIWDESDELELRDLNKIKKNED